jgi:hypothetical protein
MSRARLNVRLRRLEQVVGVAGCPGCRDRRRLVVIRTFQLAADGPVERYGDEPQPCALCGEVPDEMIRIVEEVVSSREDQNEIPTDLRCDYVGALT